MQSNGRSDQRLLKATRAGEAEAFGELFARCESEVIAYIRQRVGSAEQAGDLTAETFAAALLAVHAGKTLGCWCAPQLCHGDVLARLADELS